jgi:hypothetical protein
MFENIRMEDPLLGPLPIWVEDRPVRASKTLFHRRRPSKTLFTDDIQSMAVRLREGVEKQASVPCTCMCGNPAVSLLAACCVALVSEWSHSGQAREMELTVMCHRCV